MNIGERLKKLRVEMKKTLRETSEIFSVSLNSVYRWEHDLCIPRRSMLKKIATYYGVSYDWLLTGAEKKGFGKNGESSAGETNSVEQKILKMVSKLPENYKYNIIGYIERMCMEEEIKNASEETDEEYEAYETNEEESD
ncbi:MAG: helix-turn-helix domain-containing protein [Oscillospiraceae bacterium]|nr:helix-turn-helix domain-containing protein [Oscillospiraceae bacterium]